VAFGAIDMSGQKIIATSSENRRILTISCINKSSPEFDFVKLISALQKFLDECLSPVWRVSAKLVSSNKVLKDAWSLIFFDDADHAAADGYHEQTLNGLPQSRVFVKEILEHRQKISVRASHELAEMIINPAINLWCSAGSGRLYAYEICDPVEEEEFLIDGIAMSNFVFPAYFEPFHRPKSVQFDFLGKVGRPFQMLEGGYSTVLRGSKVFHIFGSVAKKRRFVKEDPRLKRSHFHMSSGQMRSLLRRPVRKSRPRNDAL
jgi:hypothetical protein